MLVDLDEIQSIERDAGPMERSRVNAVLASGVLRALLEHPFHRRCDCDSSLAVS
jgi:hypothetical protein